MKSLRHLFAVVVLGVLASVSWAAGIDINSATADQIAQAMKGIGPNKAEAIVLYREQNGPFTTVDDLTRVRGVGKKTIEMNRGVISVGTNSAVTDKQAPSQ